MICFCFLLHVLFLSSFLSCFCNQRCCSHPQNCSESRQIQNMVGIKNCSLFFSIAFRDIRVKLIHTEEKRNFTLTEQHSCKLQCKKYMLLYIWYISKSVLFVFNQTSKVQLTFFTNFASKDTENLAFKPLARCTKWHSLPSEKCYLLLHFRQRLFSM